VIDTDPVLYSRLLGPAWLHVSEPIRAFHTGASTRACGRLRIAHGRGALAHALIFLLRLPRASDDADVRLDVARESGGEWWRRRFDRVHVPSRQREAAPGVLAERFRVFEFHFRVAGTHDVLRYQQVGVFLGLGPVRWRLPAPLAPVVEGEERARGPACIGVSIQVTWPPAGLILAYDGAVHFENRFA
jgi:hypothetical protein